MASTQPTPSPDDPAHDLPWQPPPVEQVGVRASVRKALATVPAPSLTAAQRLA